MKILNLVCLKGRKARNEGDSEKSESSGVFLLALRGTGTKEIPHKL
jgi:hypothetical protein